MNKGNQKLLIWIMGSNASGKTTQSKLIHETLSNLTSKKLITEDLEEVQIKATIFDNSAHVGHLKDNQCTGTDTLNSKIGVDASFCYLYSQDVDYIVVDGILCTAQWLEIFRQFPIKILVILLQFPSLESNLLRIAERRTYKQIEAGGNDGADIADFEFIVQWHYDEFAEKTKKNISGKIRGFKSMYDKVSKDCDYSVEIDATLPLEEIHEKIIQAIAEID